MDPPKRKNRGFLGSDSSALPQQDAQVWMIMEINWPRTGSNLSFGK